MREFSGFHPSVNFTFFLIVIGFSCCIMHPVCLALSCACSVTYAVLLRGRRSLGSIAALLPASLLLGAVNPLFNHEGATVLCYLPTGNPLTLESAIYGVSSALMLFSVTMWFSCFNEIMTSDKLTSLFGSLSPSLSLLFSMTLRAVPRLARELRSISDARKCMGMKREKSPIKRAGDGIKLLSALITMALENSVESADSMRARGYGLPHRTSFSVTAFDKRDTLVLSLFILLSALVITGRVLGGLGFSYFPIIKTSGSSTLNAAVLASYTALCAFPIIFELLEANRWKRRES